MPNSSGAFGLRPINLAGSAPNSNGTGSYLIASNAAAIYNGSPVLVANTGTIAITGSASGDTFKHLGAFAGCEYVSSVTGKRTWSNFWPGSGANTNFDIVGYVYDNPFQRYVISTDASFTNLATAQAAIFENTQFDLGTSGSTVSGSSSARLDVATLDNSNLSLPLKIVGILNDPLNQDYAAAGIQMIVMFNNHALLQADSEGTVA